MGEVGIHYFNDYEDEDQLIFTKYYDELDFLHMNLDDLGGERPELFY